MTAIKIKKVNPYPIAVSLTGVKDTLTGRIAKLTKVGALIETERALILGHQFTLAFTIPVINKTISCVGVVIKTYARYGGEPGKSKSHALNEIHFKSLDEECRSSIHQFLASIKQI